METTQESSGTKRGNRPLLSDSLERYVTPNRLQAPRAR